jgi:hypothetical protein
METRLTDYKYAPFCIFKVHPVATESQVNEMIKALTG